MKYIKVLCAGLLSALCIGNVSAKNNGTVKTGEESRETKSVKLVSSRKDDEGGRFMFKFRIERNGEEYRMKVLALKDNQALYVIRPGLTFTLENGQTVSLLPNRDGFDHWGRGEWYNAEFRLDGEAVARLKESNVVSLDIADRDGLVSKEIPSGRQDLLMDALKDVEP